MQALQKNLNWIFFFLVRSALWFLLASTYYVFTSTLWFISLLLFGQLRNWNSQEFFYFPNKVFYNCFTCPPLPTKEDLHPFLFICNFCGQCKRDELFRILHFTLILWTPFEQVDHSYLLTLSVQISLLRSFPFLEFANIILWMSVDLFVCNWYFLDLVNTLFDYDNFYRTQVTWSDLCVRMSVCLSVTNKLTFVRLNWCDSGWWGYQLNTNW